MPLLKVVSVRSTLIQSSLNTLRLRGHFDRYCALIDPAHKATILETLAPEWLPIATGIAHYAACDGLRLSGQELINVGEDVGTRIQGTFIGTMVRRARTIGLTPWVLMGQFERLYERLLQGGGVAIYQLGPKDVRIEIHGLPLSRFEYFRMAFCGVISSGIKLGSGRAVSVKVSEMRAPEQRLTFRAAWV